MREYIISSTSSVDVDRDYLDNLSVKWIAFPYELDGKDYKDDLGVTISLEDFYQRLDEGSISKTSQINIVDYMDYFESFAKDGLDVIHLCLSSGLTGEYNNAVLAAESIMDKYKERKIFVVDSLQGSTCQMHLVKKMVDLKNEGKSVKEVYDYIEDNKLKVNTYFMTSDLTHFIRGGRVSKTAGTIGNVLNICPLLEVNYEGKLIVIDKIRTKKKAMKAMVEKMKESAIDKQLYNKDIYIDHSYAYEDAIKFKQMLEENFPNVRNIEIHQMGVIIGSHTGPGTVGFSYWGDVRVK